MHAEVYQKPKTKFLINLTFNGMQQNVGEYGTVNKKILIKTIITFLVACHDPYFIWTDEYLRPLEWSYKYRARLNKVLVYKIFLNLSWRLVMTHTSFEHEWTKVWNQLLDLRLDRRMSKTLRMVLRQ